MDGEAALRPLGPAGGPRLLDRGARGRRVRAAAGARARPVPRRTRLRRTRAASTSSSSPGPMRPRRAPRWIRSSASAGPRSRSTSRASPRPSAPTSLAALCRDLDATVSAPGRDALARALRRGRSAFVFVVDATRPPARGEPRRGSSRCLESDPACVAAVPLSDGPSRRRGRDGARSTLSPSPANPRGSIPCSTPAEARRSLTRRAALAGAGGGDAGGAPAVAPRGGAVRVADDVWMETPARSRPRARKASRARARRDRGARRWGPRARRAARARPGSRWEGKRVLFALPVLDRGGGANVVFSEARAMAQFGRRGARLQPRGAPSRVRGELPGAARARSLYGHTWDIVGLGWRYDAVVATANVSVEWIAPLVVGAEAAGPRATTSRTTSRSSTRRARRTARRPTRRTGSSRASPVREDGVERRNAFARKPACPATSIGPSFDVDTFRPRLGPLPAAAGPDRGDDPAQHAPAAAEVHARGAAGGRADAREPPSRSFLFGVRRLRSGPRLAAARLPAPLPRRPQRARARGPLHAGPRLRGLLLVPGDGPHGPRGHGRRGAPSSCRARAAPAAFARDGENAVFVDTASAARVRRGALAPRRRTRRAARRSRAPALLGRRPAHAGARRLPDAGGPVWRRLGCTSCTARTETGSRTAARTCGSCVRSRTRPSRTVSPSRTARTRASRPATSSSSSGTSCGRRTSSGSASRRSSTPAAPAARGSSTRWTTTSST